MTNGELIEILQQFPKDLRVAIIVDEDACEPKVWGYENIFGDEKAITINYRKYKK